VLALATIVCAWFAIGIRQAHDTVKASSILSEGTPLDAGQAAHVAALLRGAKLLNPDEQVEVLRGELAVRGNDLAVARNILREVVRAEPMNLQAWVWLAKASSNDPSSFLLALLHINQLEPPVKQQR
jgi:predicted Zn-dependent protease